uniref:Myb-like domain-containing protein n=1 Tax=Ditylum brightwellii TaxID=49249 RepID=A0A6U3S087_9STRA|mmetsp:Transcript_33211/g.49497  ORF Transcript_33211/g.49497 Transcript_33211/m.49497 type:complete len:319 (+) Transcript_33211:98-1054(+)
MQQALMLLADVSASTLDKPKSSNGLSNLGKVVYTPSKCHHYGDNLKPDSMPSRSMKIEENIQKISKSFHVGKQATTPLPHMNSILSLRPHCFGDNSQALSRQALYLSGIYFAENMRGHMQSPSNATMVAMAATEMAYRRSEMIRLAMNLPAERRFKSALLDQVKKNPTISDKIAQTMDEKATLKCPSVPTRSAPRLLSYPHEDNLIMAREESKQINKERVLGLCLKKKHKSWTEDEDKILIRAIHEQIKIKLPTAKIDWRTSNVKFGNRFWNDVSRDLLPHRSADSLQKRHRKIRNSFVIATKIGMNHQNMVGKRKRK